MSRKWILYLIPIALFALLFGPPIYQCVFGNSEEENKNITITPENIVHETIGPDVDENTVEPEQQEPTGSTTTTPDIPVEQQEEVHLKKPKLSLNTRSIVHLIKGENVDFSKYIELATDSLGEDVKDQVKWTSVNNTYLQTSQAVTFMFTDERTGETVSDVLLVRFYAE